MRAGYVEERFEPTYEELKPASLSFSVCLKKSFEPTYEELKHISAYLLYIIILSFEPTYEELKRGELYPFQSIGVSFWAYLWGIETTSGVILLFDET